MGRKFWIDCVLGTGFIFFLMWFFSSVAAFQIFDAFDPISEAIGDVEITDYAFNELREDPKADLDILVVNIGNLTRREVAEQVRILNKYQPKVIGIDAFFGKPNAYDPIGDIILKNVLDSVENLVLVSRLQGFDKAIGAYNELYTSDSMFRSNAVTAYANLTTNAEFQEDLKTVRGFWPQYTMNGEKHYAFGVELASYIAPEKAEKFLARNNKDELINFKGNIYDPFNKSRYKSQFFALDIEEVLKEDFNPSIVKDKIVIMGFLGSNILNDPSWSDRFFTPMNYKIAGRSNPDMFGVVVHANIVSMILTEDPLDTMSDTMGLIMAVIICFLNVMVFTWIYRRLPRWYDGITKLIQLFELLIFVFLVVIIFDSYNYKVNQAITLIAVAFASDSLEVFYGVVKNLFNKAERKKLFKLQEVTMIKKVVKGAAGALKNTGDN